MLKTRTLTRNRPPDKVAQLENDAEARRREALRVEIARGEVVKRRERLDKPMREV